MSTNTSASRCNGRRRSSAPPPCSRPRSGSLRRAAPPGRPPGHPHRDALVRQHLALADRIAAGFHRRYVELVELDDLRQEARLELVRAAARCQGSRPEPYLRRCIQGALRHHLRDRALLVRLPAKRRDAAPWRHLSLDAVAAGEEHPRLEQLVARNPAAIERDESADAVGLRPELAALLAALPSRQAAAVRLTVLEGLSLRRAGEELGASPMTVKRAQMRGLEWLRMELCSHAHRPPRQPPDGSCP